MEEYAHIDTIWKRHLENPNKGQIIEGDFASPELEYLQHNTWIGTEKIDGTNIRIMWDGVDFKTVTFGGKTDNAQLPTHLLTYLQSTFTVDEMQRVFPNTNVCLYGEGFGAKIQKGGGNL